MSSTVTCDICGAIRTAESRRTWRAVSDGTSDFRRAWPPPFDACSDSCYAKLDARERERCARKTLTAALADVECAREVRDARDQLDMAIAACRTLGVDVVDRERSTNIEALHELADAVREFSSGGGLALFNEEPARALFAAWQRFEGVRESSEAERALRRAKERSA